jgi:hypothetical protein
MAGTVGTIGKVGINEKREPKGSRFSCEADCNDVQ